jgi:hypothetical protein
MRCRTLAILICLATLYAQNNRLPAFEDYPVTNRYRGKPAVPQWGGSSLPDSDVRARETVEIEAESGPNFAGHYTVARWGCDTGCFRFVVIDAPTGKLFRDMPFATLDIGYDHDTEEHRYGGLSFRAASSLLIAEGCFDGETHVSKGEPQDCARRYYNWNGTRFMLLKSVPVL